MCGIIGIVSPNDVVERMIEGLRRLEYRGYDSAGVATISEDGALDHRRAVGKLSELTGLLQDQPASGVAGIGHTRWATHGPPTEINAHPHLSGRVAIVHNGIIENFAELRAELKADGRVFDSQTDTEVVAHLIGKHLDDGASPTDALHKTLSRLTGAFAIAVVLADAPDLLLAARRGSPLAIGRGDGETFVGSDAYALAPFTNRITYLEEGDWAVVTRQEFKIFDALGVAVDREEKISSVHDAMVGKDGHSHYMAKEIYEQPAVVSRTIAHYVDAVEERMADTCAGIDFAAIDRLTVSACGTAFYAGQIARYWFETLAGLPVEVDIASELRYRNVPYTSRGAALFISQSGETADTLAALRAAKDAGQRIAAVVNVPESTIAREADVIFPTLAGPEIGVASTKAFTCQLAALACLAIAAGRARGLLSDDDERERVRAMLATPRLLGLALQSAPAIEEIAEEIAKARSMLYMGRNVSFPLAMEGALKMKEISYIHAEGYAAGELKHGPIALVDEETPILVVAPRDAYFAKTASNLQEVVARKGRTLLISDNEGVSEAADYVWRSISMPKCDDLFSPIVYAAPIQLLAYHTARWKGTDVDQPRNLAKSVTVE